MVRTNIGRHYRVQATQIHVTPPNKSLDASGGSVFRNLLGAAKGALIRPVEIVRLISRGQLNRWALNYDRQKPLSSNDSHERRCRGRADKILQIAEQTNSGTSYSGRGKRLRDLREPRRNTFFHWRAIATEIVRVT